MSPAKSSSLLPALLLLAAIAAIAEAKCPTKCGDVDIPHPFGIGSGCSRGKDFEISCINNGSTAVLQSGTHSMQVTSLSVVPPLAKVMLPVAFKCYNSDGYRRSFDDGHVDLSSHRIFRISDARNMFVVLGCNTGAFTMSSGDGNGGGRYDHQYYMGCFTYCSGPESPKDGRCASVGCCHVDIPPGLTSNAVHFESWPHNGMEHSPCNIAFLVGKDSYEFRASDLRMDVRRSSMPVWLDWAMGRDRQDGSLSSCAGVKDTSAYACESPNSECLDSLNGPGYFCRCKQGFQGNPYNRENGCTEEKTAALVTTEEPAPAAEQQNFLSIDVRGRVSTVMNLFNVYPISIDVRGRVSTVMNLFNEPSIKETLKQISKDPGFMEMTEQIAMDPGFTEMAEKISKDPAFMEMADRISKDPAFTDIAMELQKRVSPRQRQRQAPPAAEPLDMQKYVATIQNLRRYPQFEATAERLRSALMQHPTVSTMPGGLVNPAHKEQLEARVARMKNDPTIKPILDEIKYGGPAATMKYLNDPEALQKIGRIMGIGGGAEEGEYYEDEPIVHHTASV